MDGSSAYVYDRRYVRFDGIAYHEHFFRAQAASATSAVRITVTDEEGHEYVQTMERPKSLNYQMD